MKKVSIQKILGAILVSVLGGYLVQCVYMIELMLFGRFWDQRVFTPLIPLVIGFSGIIFCFVVLWFKIITQELWIKLAIYGVILFAVFTAILMSSSFIFGIQIWNNPKFWVSIAICTMILSILPLAYMTKHLKLEKSTSWNHDVLFLASMPIFKYE